MKFFLFVLGLLLPSVALAGNLLSQLDSLHVIVEDLGEPINSYISDSQIQTTAEIALRDRGFTIRQKAPSPTFYFRLSANTTATGSIYYAITFQVEVLATPLFDVLLTPDGYSKKTVSTLFKSRDIGDFTCDGILWDEGSIGICPTLQFREVILNIVRRYVDELYNERLKARGQ